MSNKVCGKVLLKETGVGIPDLLIEVYNIDPKTEHNLVQFTQNNSNFAASSPDFWQIFSGDRLGSVPTDESGKFELIYEDSDFQRSEEEGKRPDLMVLIIAPEQMKDAPCPQILHISCGIRQNAGRVENYIIKLTKKQLEKADIELSQVVTQELEDPEIIIQTIKKTIDRREIIASELRKIAAQQIDRKREEKKQLQANTSKILESLSAIPRSVRQSLNYVQPGESVEQVNKKVIEADINNKINNPANRAPIRGQIILTEQLKQKIEPYRNSNGDYINVPGAVVEPYIFGTDKTANRGSQSTSSLVAPTNEDEGNTTQGSYSYLIQEDPIIKQCREKTEEEINARICLDIAEDEEEGQGENSPNDSENEPSNFLGNGVNLANNGNASSYIAENIEKLMGNLVSPEEPVIFSEKDKNLSRAKQKDIQKSIEDFSLDSSPADTTAYYDFHNLQIAFSHVWQEYFDENLVNNINSLQEIIINNGGNIDEALNSNNPLQALIYEGENVVNSSNNLFVPADCCCNAPKDEICKKWCEDVGVSTGSNCDQSPPPPSQPPNDETPPQPPPPPAPPPPSSDDSTNIIAQLEQRLKEDYAFQAFGADGSERSINYGIFLTYRQKWEPINYQVGELVKTIPLAPKEVRKFSKKMTVRKKRTEKEVEKNSTSRQEESNITSRAEDEIIRKANAKTSFNLSAEGAYKIPFGAKVSLSTAFDKEASKESEETKKAFREAVMKASNEYKQERNLEINIEEFEEFEDTESGEISNPNDELTVTFMFYELQRRYRVSEKIYRLTPVVLVAQNIPKPEEIDEDWLIAHDWILKRVMLDDSFLPALMYLSSEFRGDEIALTQLYENLEQHRQLVSKLESNVIQIRRRIERQQPENKDEYEVLANEEKLLRSRLQEAVTALNAATESYVEALRQHENYRVQILRLQLHIKQNIIFYMQAIWSYEDPEQRFMRLAQTSVPIIKGTKTYNISGVPKNIILPSLSSNFLSNSGRKPLPYATEIDPDIRMKDIPPNINDRLNSIELVTTLIEVADLNNLLGFKGNYLIFPLNKSNIITDLMMEPYVTDGFTKLVDPDEMGNWTLEEFSKYICCLKKGLSPRDFEKEKERLKQQYQAILSSPRRTYEDIIIPTGSLFIEALPGEYSLLEDFKLMHRAMDVKKVQAEVRGEELENLRMAARLLAEDYEDPDIEKKIVIEGNNDQSVIISSVNE